MKDLTLEFEKIDIRNKKHKKDWIYINKVNDANHLWSINRPERKNRYNDNDFESCFSNKEREETPKISYFSYLGHQPIGILDVHINHPQCKSNGEKIAWPGILIAQEKYRGKGLGKQMFEKIHQIALDNGCTHIEAAPFEFNDRLVSILKSYGFEEIYRQEELTFYQDQFWAGVHFSLALKH